MITEYLSIYLCLLQFLSSMSYSFLCTGLSLPWLNLFLGDSSFHLLSLIQILPRSWLLLLEKRWKCLGVSSQKGTETREQVELSEAGVRDSDNPKYTTVSVSWIFLQSVPMGSGLSYKNQVLLQQKRVWKQKAVPLKPSWASAALVPVAWQQWDMALVAWQRCLVSDFCSHWR